MLCAVIAGAVAAAGAAFADSSPAVKVGTLTCQEASGWGLIVGSSRHVQCTFTNGDKVERYDGSISKLGADVGYKSRATIVWAVVAPADPPKHGALEGSYVGATAGASVGVGVGANALVGGFERSISLQPVSVEGDQGLNVAAGVGALTLHAAH
jgi:hypothetical protein